MISKEKIKANVKKYKWIIIISVFIGICLFCLGCYFNINNSNSEDVYIYQNKLVLISERPNSYYIEDFIVILSSDNFKKTIEESMRNASYNIEKADEGSSIIVTVTADSKDNAIDFYENLLREGKSFYNTYFPDVNIIEIENRFIQSAQSIVQMKDLILFFFPIFVGIFLIYLRMLFDNNIYSKSEIEEILKLPVYECNHIDCIHILNSRIIETVILGKNINRFEDLKMPQLYMDDFLKGKNDVEGNVCFVVRKDYISNIELNELAKIIELRNLSSTGVFLLNE